MAHLYGADDKGILHRPLDGDGLRQSRGLDAKAMLLLQRDRRAELSLDNVAVHLPNESHFADDGAQHIYGGRPRRRAVLREEHLFRANRQDDRCAGVAARTADRSHLRSAKADEELVLLDAFDPTFKEVRLADESR